MFILFLQNVVEVKSQIVQILSPLEINGCGLALRFETLRAF